jgi:ferredoxin-type protein NapH
MMKRQQIRNTLLLISFLLFPVTLYYFSPVLIIVGAAKGIIVGSFIVFALMFFGSLLLGRLFCGWLCPAAGLQEACISISDNRAKGGKYNWIKYGIWIPWISIIIYFAFQAGGFHTIDPFYQTEYGLSVTGPIGYIIYYVFAGIIAILALSGGRRAFCHYACWMAPFMIIGNKIQTLCQWPAVHLQADKNKCISCKLCTQKCPMSLDVCCMVQKSMDNTECILCGTCADVCPKNVISYAVFHNK